MTRTRLFVLCSLLICPLIWADNIDRYGELRKIQRMSVSPDGSKVAFRSVSAQQDVVSIISVNPVSRIASVNVASVKPNRVSFISDNHLLMQVSDQARLAGIDEFEMSNALSYNIKKKKLTQLLTPGKDGVYVAQSGLGSVVGISPDGKFAYMPAYSGDATFVMGQQLKPPRALFKAKLDGGRVRMHSQGQQHTIDYFVDAKGKVLAREVFDETESKHRILSYPKKGKSKEIFSLDTPYITRSFLGVNIEETHLYMLANDKQTGRDAIYKMSLENGEIGGPFYARDDADIEHIYTDSQRKVIGVRYSGFNPSYQFFDADLDQRVQQIMSEFPAHAVWVTDISPNREHVIVYVEGALSSGDYFLFSKGKPLTFLASSRPNIPADEVHPVGLVKFKARDGLEIPTLLTIPKGKIDDLKNLPTVVMPHGGPASADTNGFNYRAQAFAEQGYLVLQPQFRGSSGLGYKHAVSGYGEWGRNMQHDITDAVKFFTKQGMVDEEKVCIVGASYGGYAALVGGAFTPDLYKCVVAINGVGNLVDFQAWIKEERGRSSSAMKYWEAQIKGFDENDDDTHKQRSPELFANAFSAPVLLIQSEKDDIVPPRQSVTMYRALKDANKQVEKIELKGEGHNLSSRETRIQALRAAIEFVNKHI